MALDSASAQDMESLPSPGQLKRMSLEELMDVRVTLVSRQSEKLNEVPSAVQVITQDDIRRFGVFTLPEALRLATNLQVAQVDARQWAISARGQNNVLSNKLLVMIDGRTVYTPLHAGVFWDVQNIMLDNVDRIEVISGPGGTLWGANAVNGVINIVTKGAESTQGGLIGGGAGTAMQGVGAGRYGGRIGKDVYYRVWGRGLRHNSTDFSNGNDAKNPWDMLQSGFRTDWLPKEGDRVTVTGNLYSGDLDQDTPSPTAVDGQYLIGRWTRDYSQESGIQAQVYFDRSARTIPAIFGEDLQIYDFDFQHRLRLGDRNALIWGTGYRFMRDDVVNSPALAFVPGHKDLSLFNGFLQDQIMLIPERLRLIVGSKLEHNDYSGFEVMPSGRLAFTPDDRQTIWGAVSRAVRSPSRIDVDLYLPGPPVPADSIRLEGGPGFKAEDLTAYEAGYRVVPMPNVTASLSAFYNWYDNLRIFEPVGGNVIQFTNGSKGEVRGVELSAGWQAMAWWQLKGGYTYLQEEFWTKPGHIELASPGSQGDDPDHQFLVQSMMDLPAGFQLNGAVRYVSALPSPAVPYYSTFDLSVVWMFHSFTFSIVGHDLAEKSHAEFGPVTTRNEVPRSVSARASWRF
ncbi:MAG: hypothetical protein JWO30_3278 [Fibrobacteres bacterium]|nr:hypothetical protein [Fibrobacterota bacterium]